MQHRRIVGSQVASAAEGETVRSVPTLLQTSP